MAAAILAIPVGETPGGWLTVLAGVLVTAFGETVRLWAVHHIGVVSRTRSERLGPLVASGPFAIVRNPLYLGNIALWAGFALAARLMWLAPLIVVLLGVEYHAIVRWEERLLESRLGDAYRNYAARVPRWIPPLHHGGHGGHGGKDVQLENFTWNETLFSERGTLVAIAAGYVLLWLKAHF